MKKYFVVMTLLSFQFSAICQSFEAADSTIRFEDLMNELYEDSVFSARMAHYAEELEKHPTYNDSLLIGKFPLIFSKGGHAWFEKFAALKERAKFCKNLNDTIKDLSGYFENEIKAMDYDSIAAWSYYHGEIFMYDKLYEGFLTENYRFFKNGKEVRWITISFWGGKQFYSWRDETVSGITYLIPVTEHGDLDLQNTKTIQPKQ